MFLLSSYRPDIDGLRAVAVIAGHSVPHSVPHSEDENIFLDSRT